MINDPQKILVIQSKISELKKVEKLVQKIIQDYNLEQKFFNKIYLCLSEAVINSIRHGNKNDKNKSVIIKTKFKNNVLKICIEDEGEGFNPENVKNPTNSSNLKNESGRGIFIMRSMSEKLEYNDKGNCVQFKIECK